ncbi:hypothetical protein R3W88_017261 [Solanum pinnatisectum]|uniref:PPM-type phosphatase domain-containing protein n=1 Tax=Solanum pinnatisectum TaxID=50273 RepID=A0AAV9L0J7_9SOLN|nr:hypothetical protein R3W88_017261 [Solanum pinnatisectum]
MEESKLMFDNCSRGNEISSNSKSPNPLAGDRRLVASATKKSLVRHPSLVRTKLSDIPLEPRTATGDHATEYLPILRSGAWTDIGSLSSMEDVYVCTDNLMSHHRTTRKHAADFACNHLPRFIVENEDFPRQIDRAISSAFLQTNTAFAEACYVDAGLASGTTALATVVIGSSLVVANAGDCRAVLCRRGKAIEMSRDHKPCCFGEKEQIEASGGYVYDGYLNGQLNVARALGNWHLEGLKSIDGGPLSGEPELMSTKLTEEDEFLIIGCDGIWDVFMSQNVIDFARRRLQEHNNPVMCNKDLVDEALKRKSGDNLSVVVVCFQKQPPSNLVVPAEGCIGAFLQKA